MKSSAVLIVLLVLCSGALAQDFSYEDIAKRYEAVKLDDKALQTAKMEGECLVGLKELNFKKKNEFDAVAEWTNYRSISLLNQYSPCMVLAMMEVAKKQLNTLKSD